VHDQREAADHDVARPLASSSWKIDRNSIGMAQAARARIEAAISESGVSGRISIGRY
jgi:hypothetical protein